ncbi:MAG: hypothetical protein RL758_341 [Pseudomonadota bacterium]|jgi:hypothetical protein
MGWANKLIGWTDNKGAEVNADGALYTVDLDPTGNNYVVTGKTGTIAAAAAAGACVFAMRLDPGSTKKAWIDMIKLRWTTIAAFTAPVTATRSLVITRGSGAATSGGTSIAAATKKDSLYGASEFDVALGGDLRIATTGALTVTGITWESTNLAEATLIQVGAAGGYVELVYEFSNRNHAVELNPGELLGVRVGPSAMDAAGTWVLNVEVAWRESTTEA